MEITEIAGYRVLRTLGAGGMGQVFLVEHPRLPRRDALKLLDAGVSRNDDFKSRFQREADLLAQLSHPNIVTLHDRGEYEGRLWITMEFVEGIDAGRLLDESGAQAPDLVPSLVGGAAAALDYAWRRQRITHRDVKPANILLAMDDTGAEPTVEAVKLADFGIAKAAEETTSLTSTGVAIGTLSYMSPEAIEGGAIDNRSDVYSLGCTAFHLITGRAPFTGPSMTALMAAHLNQSPPAASEVAPQLPAALDPVFARVLAKDPDARFQTCAEFTSALTDAIHGRPTQPVVPAYAATMAATAAQRAVVPEPERQRSSNRNGWITAITAVATAAVLAVGGAFAYGHLKSREAPTAASTPVTTTSTVTVRRTPTTTTEPAPVTVYATATPTEEPVTIEPSATPEPVEGQPCGVEEFGDVSADGTLVCSAMNGAWTDRTNQSRPAVEYGTTCTEPGARARIARTDGIATCKAGPDGDLTWSW
ncbi:serine/threonine-protein kinase [Gordonia neofelifaecis]|uniref:non-specific serine/threonine protein kinase n=1 Tax=Gordonia neofelifaecis NRRL B-59395 TaxID=644548 RepID=F1YP88_9ACTN|nr:serine/threonine-protein kinase [Gordonia neofelifaecis]EGD53483.1 serine/threonine protein kinase [Gordonia neofelifaecis NRRL B-59395]